MAAIVRSIGILLAASVAARAFGVVKSFWLARILEPADFGALVFILLLTAYAPIFALGTVETLLKKVPFFNGKGDADCAREIERGTFTFILMVAAFFGFLTLPVGPLLGDGAWSRYIAPARLMLLSISFSVITAFFYHRLEAYKGFERVSAITTIRAASVLPLQVALTMLLGLNGAVLGYLLSEVLVCAAAVLLSRSLPSTLGLRAGVPLFRTLIATGIPITIVWWTYIIQTTVDRLFVMGVLGDTATGYYGIGMSLAAAYLILPESITQVLYPSINESYGRTGRPRDLLPLVVAPTRMMAMLLPFFTCALLLVLPTAFRLFVPSYMPGLAAAQVLLVGALWSGLMRGGANLLIAVDRQRVLLWLVLGSLLLNAAGNVLLLSLGLGITGVAASTAVSSACLTVGVWVAVSAVLGASPRERIASTVSMFTPALLFTAIFLAVGPVLRGAQGGAGSPALVALALALYAGTLAALPRCRQALAGFPRLLRGGLAARAEARAERKTA